MTYARLIEGEGRMGEMSGPRLLSHWVIDRSSGRATLGLAWRTAFAAQDAPNARAA